MKIPSYDECLKLIEINEMRDNIKQHSLTVMKVALSIFDSFTVDSGLNRDLLLAGALLHDITKTRSLTTKENHSLTGAALLYDYGYPEVAEIVGEHVMLINFSEDANLTEKEIVYYSDKRVKHEEIVLINDRIKDLIERYGRTEDEILRIKNFLHFTTIIENKISRFTNKNIDEIVFKSV